ncbi:eukaryotic translation initiation factor 2 subunit 1 [Diaphorina citri]|uniref:Eukaryotic translation initiation factor 2 subunit 1 n=1 Tax=Diaphorina citri TaxID=121845 RepID=A0A3Q0J7D1_DIACI|nr:eukaryotic translation initiation factor 2 subunit 1 [Diaphorina citri]
MPLSCRFYAEKYPEVEDVVMVTVISIAEMGAYVHLLEYNNIEGMILLSELSRRRIRSINKLIRVGKTEPVVVIRVDKEKGKIMTTVTPEKADGLKALQEAIDTIKAKIEQLGGVFQVQMAPKVVTASDEAELARQMERAEAENAEVAADDDEDEEDFDNERDGDEGEDEEEGENED